jgi:hypothetical protein
MVKTLTFALALAFLASPVFAISDRELIAREDKLSVQCALSNSQTKACDERDKVRAQVMVRGYCLSEGEENKNRWASPAKCAAANRELVALQHKLNAQCVASNFKSKACDECDTIGAQLMARGYASTTIAPPDGHLRQNVPPLTPYASGTKNSTEIETRVAVELGGAKSLRPPIRRAQFQARLHSSLASFQRCS